MILAIINIFNPDEYLEYIKNNIDILINNNIDILVSINDERNYKELLPINEKVTYVRQRRKMMPGEGFNFGMRYGVESGYQYCYFIDQDSIINKNTINNLISEKKGNHFSFLASKVVDEKSDKKLLYFRGNLSNSMTFHSVPNNMYEKNPPINAAGYTGILVNLTFIKETSTYIDENYGIELDDYDFTYRLSKMRKGYLINDSTITHPNKKNSRNNWIGELVDSYIQLFSMNRSNRDITHINNYQKMILKYGTGLESNIKVYLMNRKSINKVLLIMKKYYKKIGG